MRPRLRSILPVLAFGYASVVTGCAISERLEPVSLDAGKTVGLASVSNIRFYLDEVERLEAESIASVEREKLANGPKGLGKQINFLAISGGADEGAFGAGLLVGWSKLGTRPVFKVVTGVSTGALSAPFAFLGSSYDTSLRDVYTRTDASDVFNSRSYIAALLDDALMDTAPLRSTVARYLDHKMIDAIAEEYRKGRLLLIMTTNLDAGRPVIWNIGAIADSKSPTARQLIIDVLMASAAIPGAFPPVMLTVTVDGKQYQEMHVDGGAVAQTFLYPPTLSLKKVAKRAGAERRRVAYIIRNGRLTTDFTGVSRQTLSISGRAIATMIASSGVNDTYRIYAVTKRDGVDFNLAFIQDDFTTPYKGPFDKAYMNTLFDHGYQLGAAGYRWKKLPPGL